MSSSGILCLFVLIGCVIYVRAPGPEHHEHELVDTAISNVDLFYDHKVCEALEDVDCHHHHDEKICGTNGKTYFNHCVFAKAKCRSIEQNKHHPSVSVLLVNNHGECQQSTTVTTHMPHATSNLPESTEIASGQSTIMAAIQSHTQTTDSVSATSATTTASAFTSTDLPTMTTISLQSILQSVFCKNINLIDCNTSFNVVCGSNGLYYPNECELAKAGCYDPSLREVDITKCRVPVTVATP